MIETHQTRLIMFHKQKTSARTRFLLLGNDSVCGFAPIPRLAEVMDGPPAERKLALHPGALVHDAEIRLGLPAGSLEAMGDFHAWVDVADGPVSVYLAGFTTEDPPFAAAEAQGGRFIGLPEARMLPRTELQLLRLVYEHILGAEAVRKTARFAQLQVRENRQNLGRTTRAKSTTFNRRL